MDSFIEIATQATKHAGNLLLSEFKNPQTINREEQHDIKIDLDKECQRTIEEILLKGFPNHAILGEEGITENLKSDYQWIIDPIDGTVNFFHKIPHFCISIALKFKGEICLGLIYDPSLNELWIASSEQKTTLNGKEISVSQTRELSKSILFIGCGKDAESGEIGTKRFAKGVKLARKVRSMGSAALGLAYVASGRFDAYIESRISLWDFAAGEIILKQAGGRILLEKIPNEDYTYSIVADNNKLNLSEILK